MKEISLLEAIRKEYLRIGDRVKFDRNLIPHPFYVAVESNRSGVKEKQHLFRDAPCFYYAGIDEDNVVKFVAISATKNKITLQGKTGFENGQYVLNKVCSDMFENKSLGIISTALTSEEYMEYFSNKESEKFMGEITSRHEAILATQHIFKKTNSESGETYLICGFKTFLGIVTLIEGDKECSAKMGFVPTVKMYFPEQILFEKDDYNITTLKVNK